LSWLAFAGNPFCADLEAAALTHAATQAIAWADLDVQALLGEGASGLIYRAKVIAPASASSPLAVKVFKGALTSDGLPLSEMAASLQAGAHPNLVAVHAPVTGHPDGKQALAMPLVSPDFPNLAGPPSLVSCTRDVYAPNTRLSLPALLRMAHSIASAALHLHQCGLTHGDLYAHNILHTTNGHALLGDFGAAGLFDVNDIQKAHALQRLEVRALGHLLAELLAHGENLQDTPENTAIGQALQHLSDQCCNEAPHQRPLFADIKAQLSHHLKSVTHQISE
jgi:serine/threonine protein kinase